MPKIEYSCKRKKDFVTFIAIAMFVAICLFEIYLIVLLRIQLAQENAMAHEVQKQEMLIKTARLQSNIRLAKPKNQLQECEVMLVQNCLDNITRFIRRNEKFMTDAQIAAADETLFQLLANTKQWTKQRFLFRQENFDIHPILDRVETKLDRASAKQR